MKVVINRCYGGFCISREAILRMRELGSEQAKKVVLCGEIYPDTGKLNDLTYLDYGDSYYFQNRTDSILVQVVEELGAKATTIHSDLKVIEIPDDIEFTIEEYDGVEWVAEVHRIWE